MSNLSTFHADLLQFVRIEAELEGSPETLAHGFTQLVMNLLIEAGEAVDPVGALYGLPKMHTSGYDWDEERGLLTVFGTEFSALPEVASLTKTELTPVLKRMVEFSSRSATDLEDQIDESTVLHDVVSTIKSVWSTVRRVRLVVLTNYRLRTPVPDVEPIRGRPTVVEVWDIERIQKLMASGNAQEPVSVELEEFGLSGLPFPGPNGTAGIYQSFLTVLPGRALAEIYGEYGPRLLELNVRSFLQTRGKINKGIQETIKSEPERFLAYNNGLSLTATRVDTQSIGGRELITRLHDVQIVNGGQTTASLYHALTEGKSRLDNIEVQVKLTVVDPSVREELAPRISEFSNSQNPVRMADFSANDPFHVALEKQSRVTWAPCAEGTNVMTRWFFERARGQYADAVARERTPAAQRKFKSEHPASQKLLKTDIAKYENTWSQLPHLVSLGAEKNFKEFLQSRRESNANLVPDEEYFRRVIAKAILWRKAEAAITNLQLGAYRAATVAYTLALLSYKTAQRIDLGKLWQRQDLPEDVLAAIVDLAPLVHERIVSSAGTRNVTEWAKRKECWADIQSMDWQPPAYLQLLDVKTTGSKKTRATPDDAAPRSSEEGEAIDRVCAVDGEVWKSLSTWAKQTDNLAAWQRGIAFSIGRVLSSGKEPSVKQAIQGHKILIEAERLGFDIKAATL
ncbi:AIPR family protein [Paenarthrobacter sp. CM16]|uniref:AIPR family protein n=1 Tax=Paenarthrobacter sp. CM16 TaxID=2738447 RepID=UPI0015525D11|nr:AIPR family protein [Paenarthrobacter sp. CM16]NQD88849.1 AIPR family protein [Paenarthrobacter sp. CM16]